MVSLDTDRDPTIEYANASELTGARRIKNTNKNVIMAKLEEEREFAEDIAT